MFGLALPVCCSIAPPAQRKTRKAAIVCISFFGCRGICANYLVLRNIAGDGAASPRLLCFSLQSEVDVYKAAVRWINHNRPNRMSHLERLMSTVRWVYMSAEEMIEAKHVDPALFNDPIVSNKAAMGQWQRDLLRRGIQVPLTGLPLNRVEQSHLRKIIMPGQSR